MSEVTLSEGITLSLTQWMEVAGPRRVCEWLALTADEIATRDIPAWRYWAEIGHRFRDLAATLTPNDVTKRRLDNLAETLLRTQRRQ